MVETETASVSMIQRRLRVGYTRAGRLIDMLERRGVISGYEGSKPRQVLITQADLARAASAAARPSRPRAEADAESLPRVASAHRATMCGWTAVSAAILREARNRREVELSEVEAATRIRLRYLRAIENEEWDVLPGGVYTARLHPHLRRLSRPRRRAAGRRVPRAASNLAPRAGRATRREAGAVGVPPRRSLVSVA